MAFQFSFLSPSVESVRGAEFDEFDPLEDEDDYEYLVIRACGVLRETDAKFHFGGFGHNDWKFDIGYDMSTVLEQLPELIAALRSEAPTQMELYSQGVECTLSFRTEAEIVRVKCASHTSWTPEPAEEVCDRRQLLEMSARLAIDFSQALDVWVPQIARLAPFVDWKRGNV
ncbi:hypothetical protein [Streptomyces sp. NPDC015125]|uniref:hypothetical protein n=1 Tax=Streptomyces sp. NPDC015125 TaxID=3364938 RepID=UPI0036F91D10